jgi:hypothetical protein
MLVTGIHTAFANKPADLLNAQQSALKIVMSGIGIALGRAERLKKRNLEATDRPNQVYLVDGGRGAGKTFSLLTIQHAIARISDAPDDGTGQAREWVKFAEENGAKSFRAKSLRIIFPGEFEEGEDLMEQVFAEIIHDLDKVIEQNGPKRDGDAKRFAEAQELRKLLLEKVARGWYFARRFGLDAVIRDAINYEELVGNWSKEAGLASRRIEEWRSFVNRWLEFEGCDLLVLLLDDSDNDEALTENILHSLRLVLDHPQIVTVLAGNLAAMRESLIHRRMAKLAPSVGAVTDSALPTAREWRRKLRREVEEYLEKVIPQQQRAYLSITISNALEDVDTSNRAGAANGERRRDDFEMVVGQSLKEIVQTAANETRQHFLDTKFALALQHERQRSDAPKESQRRHLETFLSWWLFGNLYAVELQPRSARNLNTMRDYYGDKDRLGRPRPTIADKQQIQPRWKKRLIVALFGMSGNFGLIQRMNDEDPSVVSWLRQQQLASDWSRRRSFFVNGRELPSLSYSNAYLRYQLDIGMGMPFRDNADEVVPIELLPHPIGRRHLRRFFQPRQSPRRQRRLGVGRWLDHAAIPSNCLYFHDLMALPDNAFIDQSDIPDQDRAGEIEKLQAGKWEGKLADAWLSTLEDDQETDADEFLARYFREIVCETLRKSDLIPSGELLNLMDPPDIVEKQTKAVYEHFVRDELISFDIPFDQRKTGFQRLITDLYGPPPRLDQTGLAELGSAARELLEGRWGEGREGSVPPIAGVHSEPDLQSYLPDLTNARRMIALYTSLASDLRRAWHAIRIYQFAPRVLGRLDDDADAYEAQALVVNKDRLRLYKHQTIRAELLEDEWVAKMLGALEHERLVRAFDNYFEQKEKFKPASIKTKENIDLICDHLLEAARDALADQSEPEQQLRIVQGLLEALDHIKLNDIARKWFAPCLHQSSDDPHRLLPRLPIAREDWRKAIGKALAELKNPRSTNAVKVAVAQGRFRLFQRSIDIDRLFKATDRLAQTVQIDEEARSFEGWTRTLRNLARSLSPAWPFHDSMISDDKPSEDARELAKEVFGKDLPGVLQIYQLSADEDAGKKVDADAVKDARSARNFVLLMYGLAPSLPAVIHANVMSRIYEAKLRMRAVKDREHSVTSDPEMEKRLNEQSQRYIDGAIEEIDKWAALIGQISVLLRCVKIMALHLDLRLLVDSCTASWVDDPAKQQEDYASFLDAVKRNERAAKMVDEMIKEGVTEAQIAKQIFTTCSQMMNDGAHRLTTGLAIFPDMAPSTLFGEGWIGDLAQRPALMKQVRKELGLSEDPPGGLPDWERSRANRKISESALSVTGIFGETEQWLWAANRALRKLREVIADDANGKERNASSEPAVA